MVNNVGDAVVAYAPNMSNLLPPDDTRIIIHCQILLASVSKNYQERKKYLEYVFSWEGVKYLRS